jgi:enoyl-[acyl-carrier protein] reductase/trans-2-enoyl-CoA reductase (NAD+)
MDRLFRERLYHGADPQPDEAGRIRLDDWEMAPSVQEPVIASWHQVTTENLGDLGDLAGYQASFLRLFGFGLEGVDYQADSDTAMKVPSIP